MKCLRRLKRAALDSRHTTDVHSFICKSGSGLEGIFNIAGCIPNYEYLTTANKYKMTEMSMKEHNNLTKYLTSSLNICV